MNSGISRTGHRLASPRIRLHQAGVGFLFSGRGLGLGRGGLMVLALAGWAGLAGAVTLGELKADPNLTPDRLMRYFAGFKYELSRETRPPEMFLAREAGDCDDFATLAADVLREKGYSTRLVVVYMPREAHVVCYVAETKAYLDYNRRQRSSPLVKCGSALTAIAAQVARSFRTQWRSASEFTYRHGAKSFVLTAFR